MARAPDKAERQRVLKLFRTHGGWLRGTELDAQGHHHRWLRRLIAEGAIERVRKGLYRLAGSPALTHQSMIDVCRAVPEGVVCLLSALVYHDLTTANPPEVYLAIDRKAWVPRVAYPPVRFFRFSRRILKLGVMEAKAGSGTIRVFDAEKTICDCVRHRTVVGQDTAIEALRTYLRRKKKSVQKLLDISRACRVERLVKNYLEALL